MKESLKRFANNVGVIVVGLLVFTVIYMLYQSYKYSF